MSEDCIICKQPLEGTSPTATLGEKGSGSINKASDSRNDTIHSMAGQQVYTKNAVENTATSTNSQNC